MQAWVEYQYNKKSICAIRGEDVGVNPVMSGSGDISPTLLPPFPCLPSFHPSYLDFYIPLSLPTSIVNYFQPYYNPFHIPFILPPFLLPSPNLLQI